MHPQEPTNNLPSQKNGPEYVPGKFTVSPDLQKSTADQAGSTSGPAPKEKRWSRGQIIGLNVLIYFTTLLLSFITPLGRIPVYAIHPLILLALAITSYINGDKNRGSAYLLSLLVIFLVGLAPFILCFGLVFILSSGLSPH